MSHWRTSLLLTVAMLTALAGCAAPPAHTLVFSGTNLALAPSADETALAEAMAGRSDWPSVIIGIRFDDATSYVDWTFDNEAYFDEHGGTYYRIRQTTQSGVLVR
ncbi:MAG: hypothetical protein LC135_15205 [Phycisphaerae bacterium]|jgi:hypothetical protein|nr:hypothetical protein [Phycisphaerae bacterium]MCZ2401189.1 hypothetical protein [Phycisphaerae bacterium]